MRKFLSIKGWNPQVYQRELVPGDYVAFKMLNSDILRVGVILETSDGKSPTAIKCLTINISRKPTYFSRGMN